MKQLNYKDFSIIFAIALLIIVGSSNGSSIKASNPFSQGIQTSEQSNLGQVSIDHHNVNDEDSIFDTIKTNNFIPYWIDKMPLSAPSARQHHAIAYDSLNDKVILYGGHNGSILGDTWAYDPVSNLWEDMKPIISPAATYGHAMVYDPVIQKVVMFSGISTWTYDYLSNQWEQQSPQVSPSTKTYQSMIYDTTHQKIMLLGGTIGAFETWEMDSTNFNWTNLNPITPMPNLFAFAASYDQANDKIIIFGGQSNGGAINNGETYIYDYSSNEWNLLALPSDPSDRRFYGKPMGYDILTQRSVFFGGITDAGNSDEFWGFDYKSTSWELLETIDPPSAKWIHTMVFSPNSNKFIIFGGSDGTYSNQTLELSVSDIDSPTIISPGDKNYELGSLSSSISWQLFDPSDGTYEIMWDGQTIETGNFVDGQTVSLVPFGLKIGNYTLKITAMDLEGNSAFDTIVLSVVEVNPPEITGPEDLVIESFGLNSNITWILEDLTPDKYTVTQNGTVIDTGNWENGDRIIVDLNSLPLGHYIFEITVTDTFNNNATNTVLVDVLDNGIPIISSPTDMDIIQGDPSKVITWHISDNNPTFYVLEVNQQIKANNSWVALPFIQESLQSYLPGDYNFTLTLNDGSGNIVSDTVIVKIYAPSVNTNTQTPQSGGGSGGGGFGVLPSIPRELAIGAGVGIGGLLMFGIIRRARGGGF